MSLVLYRKYRPCKLDEVVAQDHITETLTKALEKKQVGHAFLFTGPRGVGKTTVARLLAFALNGLDYQPDKQAVDIIEIDAASNGHVEDIRELRSTINIMPAKLDYKVYIIDEAHMISHGAVNALLKTLEEPPSHVVFILATTEAHRLPATIISRCQRFSFRPIPRQDLADQLAKTCQLEKIKAEPTALELVADYSQGSLRDGLSILEQTGQSRCQNNSRQNPPAAGATPGHGCRSDCSRLTARGIWPLSPRTYQELAYQGTNPLVLVDQLSDRLTSRSQPVRSNRSRYCPA